MTATQAKLNLSLATTQNLKKCGHLGQEVAKEKSKI